MQAKALYACQADNPGELSFSEGDIILEVVESGEPGWLLGTLAKTHERGLFPEVYVELSSFQPGDEELARALKAREISMAEGGSEGDNAGTDQPPSLPASSGHTKAAPSILDRIRSFEDRGQDNRPTARVSLSPAPSLAHIDESSVKLPTKPVSKTKPLLNRLSHPLPPPPDTKPRPSRHWAQQESGERSSRPSSATMSPKVPPSESKPRRASLQSASAPSQPRPPPTSSKPQIRSASSSPASAPLSQSKSPVLSLPSPRRPVPHARPEDTLPRHPAATNYPVPHIAGNVDTAINHEVAAADASVHKSASAMVQRPISATDAISPDAVTRYATLFKRLDTTGRGFINGRDLMEVFARSRLSEHTLASIWQHADRDLDGSLTVPEFIVAMALIDLARSGEEVPDSIPIEYLRAAYCVAF